MTESAAPRYRQIGADVAAPALEEEVLARWRDERLFDRVQEATRDGSPFVFYEGPPTANGRPGIHHVFSRTVKDLVCRHRAMRGHYVPRKGGWDTHGLPVEIEVERALGISGKQDIERIGVAEFNRRCRESVFTYRAEWQQLSERIAYWLDYDHAYATYTNDYVESVWWALRTLWDKGLFYRGHKVLPYCARCGTALSSHEVAQGYDDVEDPSIYLALELVDGSGTPEPGPEAGAVSAAGRRRLLVWTTTPWTLVSNAALAVHPDLEYVELRRRNWSDARLGDHDSLILAKARVSAVLGEQWSERWEEVARHTGGDLAGKRYRRPLDWVPYPEGTNHEIIVAEEFVTAEDGSGVVHMSPAFGADDYAAGQRHGLAFLQPVDARGRFPVDMPVVGGKWVKDADPLIIAELEQRGVLWKSLRFTHAYPHCWRCGTPLLYYARSSWFVRTTAYKDRMLARNALVDWHPPEIGSGRFGEWLENNIDWAISRDRYWGTPLPVWINDADPDEIEFIGSYAELAARVGRSLGTDFDPHKPYVDGYTWPARSGTGTMRRVTEVIDTWFDSGSMPFAQWHYPFEHGDVVARQYPGDYIAEGVDQTRGWFYSLLAIATGLGDALPNNAERQAAPYRSVIVNDLVRDAQGQKMSKSRGNAVDPWSVLERHGADATRLFLVASSQVYLPRNFDEQAIRDFAGRFLLTLRNTYSGIFAQYANFGWTPDHAAPPVSERALTDRWILSRLQGLEAAADERLEALDPTAAARLIMDFVTNDVSNWYVRVSRNRFYDVTGADNLAAFATLHEVLAVTCRLLAPFCPFLTDFIHRELTGTSVHLAPYKRQSPGERDLALEQAMEEVRELARLGRAARETAGIRVRTPLANLVCVSGLPAAGDADHAANVYLESLATLLRAELNVKRVTFAASSDDLVTLSARPNFRTLGKKFGRHTNEAAAAVRALGSDVLLGLERGMPVHVTAGGVTHPLAAEDLTVERHAAGALVISQDGVRFAAIDPTVTPELRQEGLAREIVSRVQKLRKDAALAVSDRIRLSLAGDSEIETAARTHQAWIAGEVLATDMQIGTAGDGNAARVEIDGHTVRFTLTRTE
jgi:isoleucyl-tRNA synthetase